MKQMDFIIMDKDDIPF